MKGILWETMPFHASVIPTVKAIFELNMPLFFFEKHFIKKLVIREDFLLKSSIIKGSKVST